MMRLKVAIGAALLSAALSASAAIYNFSMPLRPDSPFVATGLVSGSTFADDWRFMAPSVAASTSGSVVSVDISQFFNIDNIGLALYDSFDIPLAIGPLGDGSALVNIAVQPGSNYYFRVTGQVAGAPSGFYVFSAIAAPIEEPGSLALVAAGLAAAALGRRHQRATPAGRRQRSRDLAP